MYIVYGRLKVNSSIIEQITVPLALDDAKNEMLYHKNMNGRYCKVWHEEFV